MARQARWTTSRWVLLLVLAASSTLQGQSQLGPVTFTVDDLGDDSDFDAGNGVCDTEALGGPCTLRAAIEELNTSPGGSIQFASGLAGTIALFGPELEIATSIVLNGPGPDVVTIDALSVAGKRHFQITGGTSIVISGLTLSGGRGVDGGAIYVNVDSGAGAGVELSNLRIHSSGSQGVEGSQGGAVYVASSALSELILSSVELFLNGAERGGAVMITGTNAAIRVTDSKIFSNIAADVGGGLGANTVGDIVISDTWIDDNEATTSGGGVHLSRSVMQLVRSAVTRNRSATGGGIKASADCIVKAVNSTMARNVATASGGALDIDRLSEAELYNTTVAYNETGDVANGAIRLSQSFLTLANSLVAANGAASCSTDPDPLKASTLTSAGHNLDDDDTCGLSEAGDLPGVVAVGLGGLAGTPTPYVPLLPGSPALDAGLAGGCYDEVLAPLTSDQRLLTRPVSSGGGSICDIGAFERQLDEPFVFADDFELGGLTRWSGSS